MSPSAAQPPVPPMQVGLLDHYTLRVRERDLPPLRRFYVDVLGLEDCPRPPFPFAGHWLYSGARPIVHLAGLVAEDESPRRDPAFSTGALDHISLQARGLAATRERMRSLRIDWQESPVPDMPLHQVFVRDPCGLRIELTFDRSRETTCNAET